MNGYVNKQIMQLLLLGSSLLLVVPVCAAPDGEALYNQNCASCHGYDGHGGVGTAAFLLLSTTTVQSNTPWYSRRNAMVHR